MLAVLLLYSKLKKSQLIVQDEYIGNTFENSRGV